MGSSCHRGCRGCGHRRYRCSTWRRSASRVGGGGSSPRFRCCGTTGMATSVASATSSETQQKQSDSENQSKVVSANISASAAPKTEPAAALQPLLEEVVASGEPDGEDVALQRALAQSFLERLIRLSQGRSQSHSHNMTYSRGQNKQKLHS